MWWCHPVRYRNCFVFIFFWFFIPTFETHRREEINSIFWRFLSVSLSPPPPSLFRLLAAYYNDILIGAIACRLEAKGDGKAKLYIMTLGVLAPYRDLGVGESHCWLGNYSVTSCWSSILSTSREKKWTNSLFSFHWCYRKGTYLLEHSLRVVSEDPNIEEAYLHVQTNNEGAIRFYVKHGFTIKEMIPNYYKRIEPPDCYILHKTLIH